MVFQGLFVQCSVLPVLRDCTRVTSSMKTIKRKNQKNEEAIVFVLSMFKWGSCNNTYLISLNWITPSVDSVK